jgi:hypothetical protein
MTPDISNLRTLTHYIIDLVGMAFMVLFAIEALVKLSMYTWREVRRSWKEGRE